MAASTAPAPTLVIPADVEAAYLAARNREKAPAGHLDGQFRLRVGRYRSALHQDLAQMPGAMVQEHDRRLAASLAEDHAYFVTWRDLAEADLERRAWAIGNPQQAAPEPVDIVEHALRAAAAAGVRLELSGSTFHAAPASKLTPQLRETLTAHHDQVVAELGRRADIWIPTTKGKSK